MSGDTTVKPRLSLIVIDCPDATELARFYAEVLGWELESHSDRNWATLMPPEGLIRPDNPDGRTSIAFQRIDDYITPTWPGGEHPQQLHLDLSVPDIDAAEPALLAAGARVHEHQPSTEGSFRVYLDPAGHPVCLVRE